MKFLKYFLKLVFGEDVDDDAFKDDDYEASVERMILKEIKEHVETQSARLAANDTSQLV